MTAAIANNAEHDAQGVLINLLAKFNESNSAKGMHYQAVVLPFNLQDFVK
jgi:hypothetical protein